MNTKITSLVFYTFVWARPTTRLRACLFYIALFLLLRFSIIFLELTSIVDPSVTSFELTCVYAVFTALKPMKK